MKKLLTTCLALASFCALGQTADARPYAYGHGGYYRGRGYYGHPYGFRGYGYYPYFVGPGLYFNTGFYPGPAACYYPGPPAPRVYEGKVVRDDRAPSRDYDNSK